MLRLLAACQLALQLRLQLWSIHCHADSLHDILRISHESHEAALKATAALQYAVGVLHPLSGPICPPDRRKATFDHTNQHHKTCTAKVPLNRVMRT